jgi:hypothetical protein
VMADADPGPAFLIVDATHRRMLPASPDL